VLRAACCVFGARCNIVRDVVFDALLSRPCAWLHRAEGVLKVCDQFKSVSALKDFICSCLRAEAIKLVAARGNKIGLSHGQANNFLITKRLEGGGLSLKDTQYALDLAARFMAEDSKPTPTPAKTYLTAAMT